MTRKKIKVSSHARERARERLDVSSYSEVNKAFNDAKKYGHPISDYEGKLRKFLDIKSEKNKRGTILKIHKDNLFIYRNNKMITTYRLPEAFIPSNNFLKSKQVSEKAPNKVLESIPVYLGKLYEIYGEDNIDYEIVLPNEFGGSYTACLYVNDEFVGFGLGTTKEKSINHSAKAYLKRENLLNSEEEVDEEL